MKRFYLYGFFLLLCIIVYGFHDEISELANPLLRRARGHYTVEERLRQFGEDSRERWRLYFEKSKVDFPPSRVVFVGLKAEQFLEVYAPDSEGALQFIRRFHICAASGKNGPKLREGDLQVPEGVYRVSFLNANSAYHLSLRVNYPNEYDRQKGKIDGRSTLGGDIMIHGSCVSIGCLAMGDKAAEDLFVLSADVGILNTKVIFAPFDLRDRGLTPRDFVGLPKWAPELYQIIQQEFDKLPNRLGT